MRPQEDKIFSATNPRAQEDPGFGECFPLQVLQTHASARRLRIRRMFSSPGCTDARERKKTPYSANLFLSRYAHERKKTPYSAQDIAENNLPIKRPHLGLRFCQKERIFKPDRSHFCRVLGKNVLRRSCSHFCRVLRRTAPSSV